MHDASQEIAQLRAEVETLRQAFGQSLVMLQATHHLAMSLAATHPNGSSVADAFESFASRGSNHLLNSLASDENLELAEQLSATISIVLRSFHQTEKQFP